MQVFGNTDTGIKRSVNQDAFYVATFPDKKIFAVVCDGMGGANAGNVASQKAVQYISRYVERSYRPSLDAQKLSDLLKNAVFAASMELYNISLKDESLRGMGTTVVTAIVSENDIAVCHVGDSRAYLCSSEGLTQLTRDHSVVQNLIESGELTPEEAKNHPEKNIITRALGVEESVISDVGIIPWSKGDKLLLCSDGLINFTDTEFIMQTLNNRKADKAVDCLIDKANKNGGGDNITAVVIYNGEKG